MSVSYTGQLLVATPVLGDPNFARSVVLILDHDGDGALGVVVNRPTELPVTSVLAPWSSLVCRPEVLFQGGPVATDAALGLAELPDGVDGEPLGWRRLYGRIGLIDLDTPPELITGAVRVVRVFAGYAGWSPGQLAGEIAEGAWACVPGTAEDVLSPAAGPVLWRRVMGRQSGRLAVLSTAPADPSTN